MNIELFLSAYSTTSQVMFPILVFIIILLIRDLAKYSKISDKIHKKLENITEQIEEVDIKGNQKKIYLFL